MPYDREHHAPVASRGGVSEAVDRRLRKIRGAAMPGPTRPVLTPGAPSDRENEAITRNKQFSQQMADYHKYLDSKVKSEVAKPKLPPTKGGMIWKNLKKLRKGNIFGGE